MGERDTRALGMLGMVLVAVGFASCGRSTGGDGGGGGVGGEPQADGTGESSSAGSETDAGAASGGRDSALGGAGGGSEVAPGGAGGAGGAGGVGGAPDITCTAEPGTWWSSETKSCHACPAKPKVECDEIVAGASYDVQASILTLRLPSGRLEVASASLGVTFRYGVGVPELYADVNAAISGDTLTFDFSAYGGSEISFLSAEPVVEDSCGDYLNLHAPGVGFGAAIMILVEGNGGAGNYPAITCGKTN